VTFWRGRSWLWELAVKTRRIPGMQFEDMDTQWAAEQVERVWIRDRARG
jgi:hypothetical protein